MQQRSASNLGHVHVSGHGVERKKRGSKFFIAYKSTNVVRLAEQTVCNCE